MSPGVWVSHLGCSPEIGDDLFRWNEPQSNLLQQWAGCDLNTPKEFMNRLAIASLVFTIALAVAFIGALSLAFR